MGVLHLTAIVWQRVPDWPECVIVSYREATAPDVDSSYVTVSNNVFVDQDGYFLDRQEHFVTSNGSLIYMSKPLEIVLENNKEYVIRVQDMPGSSGVVGRVGKIQIQ